MAPLRQEDYYYEDYEISKPKKAPRIVENKEVKRANKSKKKAKLKSNIILGSAVFATALTIVIRFAMINNMSVENTKLKNELNSINNVNSQLKLAAEQKINMSEIEEYAKNNLGLQKPQNYQIEYINVDKADLIKNQVVNENKKGIKEIILNIVEFFY